MSFKKIQLINPWDIGCPDTGHIYFGRDHVGLWEKFEDCSWHYITTGSTSGYTMGTSGSSGKDGLDGSFMGSSGTSGSSGLTGTSGITVEFLIAYHRPGKICLSYLLRELPCSRVPAAIWYCLQIVEQAQIKMGKSPAFVYSE